MKTQTIRYARTGGPEVLQWEIIERPRPGSGEVRLRHTAIGVNMKEIGERKGDYPSVALPTVPGIEAAAVIERLG